jgi:phospholipid transport system transporter-binding protein
MTTLTLPDVLTLKEARLVVEQELVPGIRSADSSVVLDASKVQRLDSSALAVVLECRRRATAQGKAFVVEGVPARMRELADLYGVAELLGFKA